jgi:hypothetical protein
MLCYVVGFVLIRVVRYGDEIMRTFGALVQCSVAVG